MSGDTPGIHLPCSPIPMRTTTHRPTERRLGRLAGRIHRFCLPLRWRWALLVGGAVTLSIALLTALALDMERTAWERDQQAQATLLVDRLADELKLPMLADNRVQVRLLLDRFIDRVPDAVSVELRWHGGRRDRAGAPPPSRMERPIHGSATHRLATDGLWFGRTITYADTTLGTVAVAFSEAGWHQMVQRLTSRLLLAALAVLLLTSLAVFWLAGRMSRPMELLAEGAQLVAGGDFTIRLPAGGNDEIGDAMRAFNDMVGELEHKARMRDEVGRYLNPEVVERVFDRQRQGPQSERREVTILFADMVAFTAFSQHADTSEVVATLNRFFGLFNSIITHFGGHVDKFIGDAVMAVFNHPYPDDRHPVKAASAALAMAECCRRLHVRRPGDGREVAFRIGLNRGEVIVGNIGADERLEFTVIGDAVNVASRMEGLGGANQVVASASTFDGIDHRFELHDLGGRPVKGVRRPIRCVAISTGDAALMEEIDQAVEQALERHLGPDYEARLAGG
ncbi:MAG: adenylate/guanylate cyclase domain-containing protein [Zetaproteobacteria bacterium]|nr:MAG: adenylate/guanylate cyclase domain-containing protein [Zetaproteobacteria bacterium]